MSVVLETQGLVKRFGGLMATRDVSLRLERGGRHALIGPNGAGKTTLVNLLTGVLRPTAGRILLNGADVTNASQHQRVRCGLVRTFQINQLFPEMTPLESVAMAICERDGHVLAWWRPLRAHRAVFEEAYGLLARLDLADLAELPTRSLAYGKQRLLELAIALARKPQVLLLDEPAAGVAESDRAEILAIIDRLPTDVSVLLIEHDMDLVFRFARRMSVLVGGALIAEGTPEQIAADPRVREAYLGESEA